jgi:hypothetical protein
MPGEHVAHAEETADGLHVHGDENAPTTSPASATGPASPTEQEPLD